MMTMRQELAAAAEHWSRPSQPGKTRWWKSPTILRHINRIVCGRAIDGPWQGLVERMGKLAPSGFSRGISIGCGEGFKEIQLLKAGIVRQFDLFEISQARVERGRKLAAEQNVADRIKFHNCDAFETSIGLYDLVYWNNALHHMLDTEAAVIWSREHLSVDGWFVMDDFVGASRFQWSDAELSAATRTRELLAPSYLRDPIRPGSLLAPRLYRPAIEDMIKADPTEAADSENILPAIKRHFSSAEIIPTGGCLYHLALNDVIANFDESEDRPLLEAILLADQAFAAGGLTQYAVAFAKR